MLKLLDSSFTQQANSAGNCDLHTLQWCLQQQCVTDPPTVQSVPTHVHTHCALWLPLRMHRQPCYAGALRLRARKRSFAAAAFSSFVSGWGLLSAGDPISGPLPAGFAVSSAVPASFPSALVSWEAVAELPPLSGSFSAIAWCMPACERMPACAGSTAAEGTAFSALGAPLLLCSFAASYASLAILQARQVLLSAVPCCAAERSLSRVPMSHADNRWRRLLFLA